MMKLVEAPGVGAAALGLVMGLGACGSGKAESSAPADAARGPVTAT